METSATLAAEVLTRTVERLSTADSLKRVTEIVAGSVRTLMGADGATFVLREDGKCFYADEDAIGPLWKGSRFPMTACISGWSMLHKEVVLVPDIYADARIPHDAYRPTFVKSLCMAPIRAADPIGALGAYWKTSHTPSPSDLRLIEVVANSAAVALENLELRGAIVRRSAERDDLASRKKELESAIHSLVHDMRNPLGAMMGFAQMLQDRLVESPEEADEFARTIVSSGRQLAAPIDRMLALYRITNEPIVPAPVDLTRIGHELVKNLSQTARGRHVEVAIQDDLRTVADPVLARLMLENLLANAFKYTGKKPEARIELGQLDRNKPLSTFFVRDNGDGFSPTDAHRLFRPMTRLHRADEFPGTGLGLASVARIVELHGGNIRAEGEKSVGASFFFTLPAAA
jgi:signal transduction histidine kinase